MAKNDKTISELSPIREALREISQQAALAATPVRAYVTTRCEDCRVNNAFHAWRSQHLSPSFNWLIDFANWGIPPAGKRAVIEQVTATITVPIGEWARLRMYTSLVSTPSNLDLVLTLQGQAGGKQILSATHAVRAYSDQMIEFNVNRDNAETEGDAFICISGFFIDI